MTSPREAIVILDLPHPGAVVPGSVRHLHESPPEPLPFDMSHMLSDEEHAAIAAELDARKNLPETHPDWM